MMRFGSSPRVRGTLHPHRSGRSRRRFIPACAGNAQHTRRPIPIAAVHPRVCGERQAGAHLLARQSGSSPRVRGTHTVVGVAWIGQRFIPACAGNAKSIAGNAPAQPVHPRVCGERAGFVSSAIALLRFIPACAGNASVPTLCVTAATVHPRVCGERLPSPCSGSGSTGSSPRVRGTPVHASQAAGDQRFIPACAGNAVRRQLGQQRGAGSSPRVRGTPSRRRRASPRSPVHPRVCGERSGTDAEGGDLPRFIPACAGNARRLARRKRDAAGSSPRVRGTPGGQRQPHRHPRFIPACAGNAAAAAWASPPPAVHPRVCGERARRSPRSRQLLRFIPACAGNAGGRKGNVALTTVHPRVCGERAVVAVVGQQSPRFIPACAGNAPPRCARRIRCPVHPRVCGERRAVAVWPRRSTGSSPRVRGTPQTPRPVPTAIRFIPACAGNAPPPRLGETPQPVHPRVCGERAGVGGTNHDGTGSSPRVRGTRRGRTRRRRTTSVHPRVCGERGRPPATRRSTPGSSPRVRGTRPRQERADGRLRFIPACAGNARSLHNLDSLVAVHPRVCGERNANATNNHLRTGSSPRVRGTLNDHCTEHAATAVHPRVCGERAAEDQAAAPGVGSSPRVRGTRVRGW